MMRLATAMKAQFWTDAAGASSVFGIGWRVKANSARVICPTSVFLHNRKQLIVPAAGTLQLVWEALRRVTSSNGGID
jgi:hypothetical protein